MPEADSLLKQLMLKMLDEKIKHVSTQINHGRFSLDLKHVLVYLVCTVIEPQDTFMISKLDRRAYHYQATC